MYTPNNNHNKPQAIVKDKACFFCLGHYQEIDYKEAQTLRRFTSSYAKIMPTRKSGLCSKHQRKLANAIKKARIMALLPFVKK